MRGTFEHVLEFAQDCLDEGDGSSVFGSLFVIGEEVFVDGFEHLLVVGAASSEERLREVDHYAGLLLEARLFSGLLVVLQLLELLLEGDGELEPFGIDLILLSLADLAVELDHCPGDVIELLTGEGLGLGDAL